MTTPQEPATEGTAADHSRSGKDVADAIGVAERGSSVEEVHDRGTGNTTGEAPVEQTAGDPEMTGGQVVHGSDDPGDDDGAAAPGTTPGPGDASSGAAQSVRGARPIDQT